MVNRFLTLNDVFTVREIASYWGSDSTYNPLPWEQFEEISPKLSAYSMEYIDALIFSDYGQRGIAPIVRNHLNGEYHIDSTNAQYLSRFVLATCYEQWKRYCAAYVAQYNPAENYSMTETGLDTERNSGTDSDTQSYTDYKETNKYGHAVKSSGESGIYGFDSNDAVNADTSVNVTTYEQTDKDGNALEGDTREISGSRTDTTTHGHVKTLEHSFTRAGNIGVKTSAEMLRDDIDLWAKTNLWSMVARDTAQLLTIPIYD